MAEPALRRMSLDEFLDWEDGSDTRYELWGGVIVAMAPPMPRHGRVAARLIAQISNALRGRPECAVYSEAGIARPDRNDTCYVADIAVSCTPLRPDDRLLRDPVLIVEVLSPSTAAADRQFKVADYRRIASVAEILLIDSESMFAEVLRRDGDRWLSEIAHGREAVLRLHAVPLVLPMSELYEGIPMPEAPAPALGAG
jgi:Uma2 family endonuclease